MPASQDALAAAFGYAGLVMTIVYFMSPMLTARQIVQKKSIQSFSAIPNVVGVFNCSLWCYYCFITMSSTSQDLTPNLICNTVGAVMFTAYVVVFLVFADIRRPSIFRQLLLALGFEAMLISFFELAVPHLNWTFHWGGPGIPLKSSVCGLVTDVVNVCLYGSPLVVLRQVIRTKSVKFMPLSFSALTLSISCLWGVQAVLIGNMTVLIPQLLGICLGLAQLALYACYCRGEETAQEPLAASI
eukprot:TRINITY_DN34918_c0_g1_i1.p1 TRINITY_DN34918_c0_g1~~TRINITY_DN34918_c0_g1_i1.p1  ORF type:complete len:243 (+),score=34.61 TRINITY_DN34918_c0_g1_i1:79-807(+)